MEFLIYSVKYFRSRPTSHLFRSYKTSTDDCDYHYLVHARGNYQDPDLNYFPYWAYYHSAFPILPLSVQSYSIATAITTRTYTYFHTICLLSIGVFLHLMVKRPLPQILHFISGLPDGLLSDLCCNPPLLSRYALFTQVYTPPRTSANKSVSLAISSRFLNDFGFK